MRSSTPAMLRQIATPAANPPTGSTLLYVKSDGKVYTKTSTGTEVPVNGVDLTSAQTIAGVKTFSAGLWDGANRAYSDSNPPQTLQQTLYPAGSVATPVAGQANQFTQDGKTLHLKAPDGTVTLIGPTPIPAAAPTRYDTYTPTNSPAPTSTTNVAFTFSSTISLARPTDSTTITYEVALETDILMTGATGGTCIIECLFDGVAQTMQILAGSAMNTRIPAYKVWPLALTAGGSAVVVTFRARMAAASTGATITNTHTRAIVSIARAA